MIKEYIYFRKFHQHYCSIFWFQFNFIVDRTTSGKGYVAIDVVEFKHIEGECAFYPPDAKPVPTSPPTTIPTTTIEPTEPDDCKFYLFIQIRFPFSYFYLDYEEI